MSRLAGEVAARLASRLPDPAREWLTGWGLFIVSGIGLRRIPVRVLRGGTRLGGQPGTLLLAGHDPWVRYLPERFFAGDPQDEMIGKVSIWGLPRMLRRLGASADLTVARVDRRSARFLFGTDYLAVPEWVGTRLSVPDDLDQLVRKSDSIRRDMNLVRRHDYQPLVIQGEEGVDVFYNTMYLPFTQNRYGDLAFVRSLPDLRRRARSGGVLWIRRDGQPLAGLVYQHTKHTMALLALGTANGDLGLIAQGIITALYYYSIQHARRLGCTSVDLRGNRPSLHDGLLRYKAKWGVVLYDKPDSYHDLLIRWNSANSVVKHFLSRTALIFREAGGLSALHLDESQTRRSLWIEGLQRLHPLTSAGSPPAIVP